MNLMNLTNLINLFTKNTLLEVTLSNQSALKSQYFLKQVTIVPLKCSFLFSKISSYPIYADFR